MKIDFELQLQILEAAAVDYPRDISVDEHFPNLRDDEKFQVNCIYLKDHKLIELPLSTTVGFIDVPFVRITTRGIDFLLPNGGMTSLLNTTTIKFDADQFREILLAHVETKEGDQTKKSMIRESIKGATTDLLKSAFLKISSKGLEHLPDVDQLFQKLEISC